MSMRSCVIGELKECGGENGSVWCNYRKTRGQQRGDEVWCMSESSGSEEGHGGGSYHHTGLA